MLPYTLMCGSSAWFWNTMAMSRSLGSSVLTTRPPIRIVPAVTSLEAGDQPEDGRFAAAGHQEVEHHRPDRAAAGGLGTLAEGGAVVVEQAVARLHGDGARKMCSTGWVEATKVT
jgi:hypothetical protein